MYMLYSTNFSIQNIFVLSMITQTNFTSGKVDKNEHSIVFFSSKMSVFNFYFGQQFHGKSVEF